MDFIQLFLDETRAQIKNLNASLLVLSRDHFNQTHINAVFRILHTIKGSAALIKQPRIETLVDTAESFLENLRNQNTQDSKFFMLAILKLTNQLRMAIDQLQFEHGVPSVPDAMGDTCHLGEALNRIPPLVTDLSQTLGKDITVDITHDEIMLTAASTEKLMAFIVQLVRNAADHGIEPPGLRVREHKSVSGLIRLSVTYDAATAKLVLVVADDGQGIDMAQLRRTIIMRGKYNDNLVELSDAALLNFIFQPGISTLAQPGRTSGRGVGLDIIKTTLEELQGQIDVTSRLGQGTVFTITLPCAVSAMPTAARQQVAP